jgi:hypothetical protein
VSIDPASTKVPVTNINLRDGSLGFDTDAIDHINIEKSDGVHALVLAEIRKVCPLRVASAPLPATPPQGYPGVAAGKSGQNQPGAALNNVERAGPAGSTGTP